LENKIRIAGPVTEILGKVREVAGKVLGDAKLESEGKAGQAAGKSRTLSAASKTRQGG
jgi:uncharacterized protein YjbJ (UPF0337 family)